MQDILGIEWKKARIIILSSVAIPFTLELYIISILGERNLVIHNLHGFMEFFGIFIYLLSVCYLVISFINSQSIRFLVLALGFASMGLFNIAHSVTSETARGFFWFRSLGDLSAGIFFLVAVILSERKLRRDHAKLKKISYLSLLLLVIFLSGVCFFFTRLPHFIPLMTLGGMFTNTAIIINLISGLFFLSAGLLFLSRYKKTADIEDFLFFIVLVLFCEEKIAFYHTRLWGLSWWLWHLLRLSASTLIAGYLMRQYVKSTSSFISEIEQRKEAERELIASQQQLRASNQQLRASEQQLRASEQQLRAANQQLHASQQQLRASNQQLRASEQQLRAANQQLKANNLQLQEEIAEHKRIEEALRASEYKYRILVDQLPQKIFLKDRNSVYVSCNNNYAKDLKIKPDDIIGKTDYYFYPKELAEKYRADDKRIMGSGKIEDIEEKYIQDGQERIVHTVKVPVKDEKGNIIGILGIFRDITERKKAYEALRESENRLQSVLETIQEGITLSDETGYFYVYNLAMEKLTGYSMEEANTCSDFTGLLYPRPEDRQRAFEGIVELLERGTSREAEMTILTKNGQSKCILVWSSLTLYKGRKMFLSAYRDIAERKQAEDKIRQAAEEWRTTFDSIVDLVSIHDKDFKIMMVNKAFADVFKMKYQEIIGKTCYELVHRSKEPHFCCPYKQVMQTKKASLAEFFEPQLGFYLEVSCSPIINEKGEVMGTVHIAKDITSRKEIEKRERLAQLGGLVADMAHEVNNPLMIISGNAQLSLMEEIQNETVKNNLKVIFEECRRAKDIIQRLLKFSRPSKGELKEIDINVILDAVMSIVEHQFKLVGIEIKRNYARDLPFIKVDEQQIQEVFMNLLNNANEAMPEGGVIEVATSCENDFLRIDLKDTGCGMSEEVMKRIIEPFFTTKEKGTGLGLSVCYGIIKAHNGELKFESTPGKGATATIFLPLRGIDNV